MRDDIHKKVPRPPSIQRWVRMAVNDADRLADRPFEALRTAQADTCRREISPAFVRELTHVLNASPGLFGYLDSAMTPRDLSGRGGPAEMEILSEAKRLVACGMSPSSVAHSAIASTMRNRAEADIRATAAVLPRGDAKTPVVLDAMRENARRVDYGALAELVCNGAVYEIRTGGRQTIDMDGDLRGAFPGGAR